jgi:hypothetical protein
LPRGHRIGLAGLDFIPDPSGALHAPDFAALVVADLHLEKGSSLARRGVHLPPYDTRQTLAWLSAVIARTRPHLLIFLGDSFHDAEAHARIEAADLAALRALAERQRTIWIAGNHDPDPPADVAGAAMQEVALGPVMLRHAPRPLIGGEFEIAGHLHPAAAVVQRSRRIRCRCFVADRRRIVMPAFGSYTGSLDVTEKPFAGLFEDFEVWMLGARAIHRFPAKRIR